MDKTRSIAARLQRTKLFAPAARTRLVERPQLLERLNQIQSPGYKAALISAPAGSGKTTLVIQWLASQGDWPSGWVSLDERDNRPELFFGYLIAALQEVVPGVGEATLELLQLPGAKLEDAVTALANDLANAPGPFVLILDDLHTITNPIVYQALDLLVDAQPPQMRTVILTREDPPLHLARRRAKNQLVELRQDDLRFSLSEAVDFLNHSMELRLSTGQAEILENRTEGWIAGLQMAALSLQHSNDVDQFIHDFSGSHRFILDYLMDEVFANQPADVQTFLLETSILERMCADLCAAITGVTISVAQELLEHLVKTNLFVYSLDEKRLWYRYHHLFADLLLVKLQNEEMERVNRLYRRASDWYEENGDARLAVEYAFKAQDMSRAADLIELHITENWQTVDLDFLFFVKRLPMEVIAERPFLALQSAWVCVVSGQTDRILPFLEIAERQLANPNRPPDPNDDTNDAFAKTLRAYLADLQNEPVSIDDSLGEVYAAIPENSTGMRNSVAVMLGTIYYMEGDFLTATRYYADALERDKRVGGTNAIPISVLRVVWALQKQGRLRQAFALVTDNENYVRQRGNRRFYIVGALNLLWGEILLEWNRLDEAEIQIREGLRLMEDWPIPQMFCLGYNIYARLLLAQDDVDGARTILAKADDLRQGHTFHPEFIYHLERTQTLLWSAERNLPALETFARGWETRDRADLRFRYEAHWIELSRALLALERFRDAADILERLSELTGERQGSRITILTLLTVAYHDQPALAEAALEEALSLAMSEGYLRTFVDAGERLRETLNAWVVHQPKRSDDPLQAYAQQILLAFEGSKEPLTEGSIGQNIPEPLSPREREVLQFVAEGLTNQQIADRLVISIRTVKKHIENILGKLAVKNRTQAVARGRELGLLDR